MTDSVFFTVVTFGHSTHQQRDFEYNPCPLNKCTVAIDSDYVITGSALLRSPAKQRRIIACRPGAAGQLPRHGDLITNLE